MIYIFPYSRGPPPSISQPIKKRDSEENMKIIKTKDYYGNYQCVPVDDVFFKEWCNMRNENYNRRRREKLHDICLTEEKMEVLCVSSEDPVFEDYARMDEIIRLYEAIKKLTPIQRRRIYMLLDNMSYTDIAREEGRDLSVVHRSIGKALVHLRRLLDE